MASDILPLNCVFNGHIGTIKILILILFLCHYGQSNGQLFGPALEWRLAGGNVANEGRLEVRLEQPDPAVWHTICSSSSTIIPELICADLGWPFPIPCSMEIPPAPTSAPSVAELGDILSIFALCRNDMNLQSLSECDGVNFESAAGSCEHEDDVWISCLRDTSEIEVRLVDGLFPGDGYVQTKCPQNSSDWSRICRDHWDPRDANVVCKQLGYAYAYGNDAWGTLTTDLGDFAGFNNVYCTGEETSFGDCELVSEQNTCYSSGNAEVICAAYYQANDIEVPLCGTHSCDNPYTKEPNRNTRTYCKCDCACIAFNDCCFDFDASVHCPDLDNPEDFTINDINIRLYDCIEFPESKQNNIGLVLVGKCPNTWTDVNTRLNCEVTRDLDDVVGLLPVSDNNNVTYKNIFCAQCHGKSLDDVTLWNVEAQCSPVCAFDPVLRIPIPSGIGHLFRRPNENVNPRYCPANFIQTCPVDTTDDRLISACASYFAPFALTPSISYPQYPSPYRNPHCALCNGVPETLFTEICYDCIPEQCSSSEPKASCTSSLCPRGTDFLTVETLFNFNTYENDGYGEIDCEEGTAYDPFLKACRSLSCPPDFILIENTCQSLHPPDPRVSDTEIIGSDFSIEAFNCLMDSIGLDSTQEAGIIQAVTSELRHEVVTCIAEDIGCDIKETSVVSLELLFQADDKLADFIDTLESAIDENPDLFPICNITRTWTYISYSQHLALPSNCHQFKSNLSAILGVDLTTQILLNYGMYEYNETTDIHTFTTPSNQCLLNTGLNCTLTVALNQSEFLFAQNNSVYLLITNTTLEKEEYLHLSDGSIKICSSVEPSSPAATQRSALDIIAAVCGCLSVLGLLATLITYIVFATLRNLAGKAVMNLVIALLVGYLCLLLAGFFVENETACSLWAIITQFFWIAAFSWMMIFAFNVARTFSRGLSSRRSGNSSLWKYMIVGWAIPVVSIIIGIGLHFCDCTNIVFRYGNPNERTCFLQGPYAVLYAFVVPISALLLLSIIFFLYMAVQLRLKRSASKLARTEGAAEQFAYEAAIYLRLSAVIGATWIFAYLYILEPSSSIISYIYVILNSLQGVFVFLAFGMTSRVRNMWREKYATISAESRGSGAGTGVTPLRSGQANSNTAL